MRCAGLSSRWPLLLQNTGSRHAGLSSCCMRAQQLRLVGSRAQAQQLWHMGLIAPRHVGSSWARARTCVSCIGRRIPNHCATREALKGTFLTSQRYLQKRKMFPRVILRLESSHLLSCLLSTNIYIIQSHKYLFIYSMKIY